MYTTYTLAISSVEPPPGSFKVVYLEYGNALPNILLATTYDTEMLGYEGNDLLVGGPGDDTLEGGEGSDILDGGLGVDYVSYFEDAGPATVDLAAGYAIDGGGSRDSLRNFENIIGSPFDDLLIGDSGDNALGGFAGADRLIGGAGSDQLRGGDGDDRLYGGNLADVIGGDAGDDMLQGDAGNDTMRGGSGDDRVFAGSGDDVLMGDNGADYLDGSGGADAYWGDIGDDRLSSRLDGAADTFNFRTGSGSDRIFRYELGVDRIDLHSGFGFSDGEDALASMTAAVINSSGNAVLNLNGTDVIQLVGFAAHNPGATIADLADDIFIF